VATTTTAAAPAEAESEAGTETTRAEAASAARLGREDATERSSRPWWEAGAPSFRREVWIVELAVCRCPEVFVHVLPVRVGPAAGIEWVSHGSLRS
jgi:hypothetical protein